MWVAKIRRSMVPGQPREKVCETPSQWKKSGSGRNPSGSGNIKYVDQACLGKNYWGVV
jgi:hypothetical protein